MPPRATRRVCSSPALSCVALHAPFRVVHATLGDVRRGRPTFRILCGAPQGGGWYIRDVARLGYLLAVVFVAVGCHNHEDLPLPAAPLRVDAAVRVDAAPVVLDASADALDSSPEASVHADAAKSVPLLDSPPWPDAATRIRLTWVLYPVVMRNDVPARRIELVVRAGVMARRFVTERSYSGLAYALQMQPCSDISPKMPAELFMNGAGNTVYSVTRDGDVLVVSVGESADGLCEPGPCPVARTTLARIPVPPGVTFEQRFHVVDQGGKSEHDETCPP